MSLREVPVRQWPTFLEGFALQHEGWLCTVYDGDKARRGDDFALRLRGLALVDEGKADARISILVESARETFECALGEPSEVLEEQTAEGVSSGLLIRSRDGGEMRLVLRSPIAPELVDGLPP
jgi:hypothetical protein